MHRIDGPGATADNKFTEGNPGAGIPATDVTADVMNALQEEICAVVEASGLALVKANNAQLLEALRRLTMSTGDVKLTIKTVADPGWVMCNDGTIGSASSGATTRAHADTQALYTLLWNNVSDTYAPVSTGRGASAAADFAANKTIALTKMLGRALGIGGAGAGLTARSLGQTVGAETHTLTTAEAPLRSHSHGVNDPGHSHTYWGNVINDATGTGVEVATGNAQTGVSTTGITIQANGDGSATPHNNMQPTSFLNAMIKL